MNEYLKKARETLGLNKVQMGELLGITSTAYGMIENGHRSLRPSHIKCLVEKTGVRRAWLENGELPILKDEEVENTLQGFRNLTEEQKKLVLNMIQEFNSINGKN